MLCFFLLFFFWYLFSIQSIKIKFIIFTCTFHFVQMQYLCTASVYGHMLSLNFSVINACRHTYDVTIIIWFEDVVYLWLYCCFQMIVLSFAKWHVDVSFILSHARIECANSTHFHVVMANCVTIWLIVCHMMLFCCFNTLRTALSQTMQKRMVNFCMESIHCVADFVNEQMMSVCELKWQKKRK